MDAGNSPTAPLPASAFLVGIGGSGMMPLAALLAARGVAVAGSDRSLDAGRTAAKFAQLRAAGVALFPQDGSGVAAGQLVIASAAIEDTVPDIARAAELGCERVTRAQMLARLFNAAPTGIAVAGTSGKSTTTAMIAAILHACGRDPQVMNGAVMLDFAADDPFASALAGRGGTFVSEVDESDGSIALYDPRIAVLTNVSVDHKDMAELRQLFGDYLARSTLAVVNTGDGEAAALAAALERARLTTVAVDGDADLSARDLGPEPFAISFELVAGSARYPVRLGVPGRHNVANALAAIAASHAAGVGIADAAAGVERYRGIRRRFEAVGTVGDGAGAITVIDDFGHNPDKIAATLATLRDFPGRVQILFQPHGYGPIKRMGAEIAAAFARGLAPGDRLFVTDPVDHGGTADRAVGSGAIVNLVVAAGIEAVHVPARADAAARIVADARPGDRIVVMGARDDTLGELARDLLTAIAARVMPGA